MTPTRAIGVSGRLTGWKAVVVWVSVPIDIGLLVGAFIPVALIPGLTSNGGLPLLAIAILALAIGAFGIVGSLVATRLPSNPIGWILATGVWLRGATRQP